MKRLPSGLPKTFAAIFEVAEDATGVVFLARSLGFDKQEKPVANSASAPAPPQDGTALRFVLGYPIFPG